MKSLFEQEAAAELQHRLSGLEQDARPGWGKMDVAQMLAHCSAGLDMAAGRIHPKGTFLGKLIGRRMRPLYSSDKPMGKNSPTARELIMVEDRKFLDEKQHLAELINSFHDGGPAGCTTSPHPFFGPLTPEEWGKGMYKHIDHHFRQFGI